MNGATQGTLTQQEMTNKLRKNRSSLYKVLSKMKYNENDPLRRAISNGQLGLAMTMIDQGCYANSSHLIDAIRKDYHKIVSRLIASGVDVDGEDLQGEYGSISPLYKAVEENKVECARLLLEAGAEVDKESGADGWTPLQRAAMLQHIPVAKVLVEYGADPNKKSPQGWAPIQIIRNKRSNGYRES